MAMAMYTPARKAIPISESVWRGGGGVKETGRGGGGGKGIGRGNVKEVGRGGGVREIGRGNVKEEEGEVGDENCLKMGDFVVFSSVEEGTTAYLASSSISEDLVVVHPAAKNKSPLLLLHTLSLSLFLSLSLNFLSLLFPQAVCV